MNIQEYIKAIDEQWRTGIAREHSYRPALQQLLAELLPQCIVTNEPAHFECGAPDYIISQRRGAQSPVFFVEAKDLFDNDLDGQRQHREQFTRYKQSLDYIIFTDYLDFHVYEHGEWKQNVRLAEQQGQHIRMVKGADEAFLQMVQHLANSRPQPVTSPSRLAQLMAAKARLMANVIMEAFEHGRDSQGEHYYDNSQLNGQLEAFRHVLIHDLEPEGFADIYAQTVAYGMFAARLHDDTPEDFSRQEAAMLIPKTNPFLRQIFQQIAGYDLDERIAWIVDDLAQTFLVTDVEKVMRGYGQNSLHSDPMIHFYEDFLSAYNPKLRKSKGVWYTPQPVVTFIVRAVDEVLKRDFHLPMGLADESRTSRGHRVQILDPATGTGTFLAEVVSQIYQQIEGMQGAWQSYVEDHLLSRLHGFELLMASYAIAHLKLDMLLGQMGYDSAKARNQRLRVYLTNSLEECHPDTGTLFSQWLSNEANEANYIKRDCPVMVMVGNPPYSVSSSNKSEWITGLVEDYKKNLNERNIQPLSDDYIKFIRLAQDYIERNGQGVVGYITNNSFLDGLIHREMRRQLLLAFDDIYIVNLHGNSRKKETAPDGTKDENVFDIMQGVSISILVRRPDHQKGQLGHVYYHDLYGTRESKYQYLTEHSLANDVEWTEIRCVEPEYLFVPKDFELAEEYDGCINIEELMPTNAGGMVTSKDELVIKDNYRDCESLLNDFKNLSESDFRNKYPANDSSDWTYALAKASLPTVIISKEIYRPFDFKYLPYSPKKGMISRPRYELMKHMLKENIGLVLSPQGQAIGGDNWNGIYISDTLVDKNIYRRGGGIVFPLHLYTTAIDGTEGKTPNLNKKQWQQFNDAVGREVSPEELLAYIYGVLHSPSYRERYKEFLKIDFPRIPLPESTEQFNHLVTLGQQLIDLHLMKNCNQWPATIQFPDAGDMTVSDISMEPDADNPEFCTVHINAQQRFTRVPLAAWNAYIGGYQPAQKWLKDRRTRQLTFDDVRHYMHIIYALSETQRIMNEIG